MNGLDRGEEAIEMIPFFYTIDCRATRQTGVRWMLRQRILKDVGGSCCRSSRDRDDDLAVINQILYGILQSKASISGVATPLMVGIILIFSVG